MQKELEYSFDDALVTKFCYDFYNRKIEIQFSGYFDIPSGKSVATPFLWTIEGWEDAKSKIWSETKFSDLDDHIGIFSMILSLEISANDLYITVETIDDRYVDIIFVRPQLSFLKL